MNNAASPADSGWEDSFFLLFPIVAGAIMLSFVGIAFSFGVAAFFFLAGLYVVRWERRVNSAVERYIKSYGVTPHEKRKNFVLQNLFDAVGLTLRNNWELTAVRKRIRKRGLPDPLGPSLMLNRVNLYKFFRSVRRHDIRLDEPGGLLTALGRYTGEFSS
jgi:hypothetical protein